MSGPSSNPHARSYWGVDQYAHVLLAAAATLLDGDASPRQREQATRRLFKLWDEAARLWPSLFTPGAVSTYGGN